MSEFARFLAWCSKKDKYGHIFHLTRDNQYARFGTHDDSLDDQLKQGEE